MVVVRPFISRLICCKIGDGLTDFEEIIKIIVAGLLASALIGVLLPDISKLGGLYPALAFFTIFVVCLLSLMALVKILT